MTTINKSTDQDFDRIFKYQLVSKGLEAAEVIIEEIFEDINQIGNSIFGRYSNLTFHRGRNGFFIFFEICNGEANVYAIYHRRENYAKAVVERLKDFRADLASSHS